MKLRMSIETVRAQIDVCGDSVAYVAKNASGVVSNDVMWALNQAEIALQDAYRKCGEEEE